MASCRFRMLLALSLTLAVLVGIPIDVLAWARPATMSSPRSP